MVFEQLLVMSVFSMSMNMKMAIIIITIIVYFVFISFISLCKMFCLVHLFL